MISAKEVRQMPSNADEFFENLLQNQLKSIENAIISRRKQGGNSVTIQISKPYKGFGVEKIKGRFCRCHETNLV